MYAIRSYYELTDEATRTLNEARDEAERIIEDAKAERERIKSEAYQEGVRQGHEEGYESGKDEVERLVARIHKILNAAIDKRREIIMEAENHRITSYNVCYTKLLRFSLLQRVHLQ